MGPMSMNTHTSPQTARALRLIGVPTDIGASRLGSAMGPDALRVAGLAPALRQLGCQVSDIGNLAGPPNPQTPPEQGLRHLAPAAPGWTPCTRPWARRWTMASCR